MELLGIYKNGNFTTKIFSDGTKVRETEDDEFRPAFAENMDIKICNYCDMSCPFCHEGSTTDGMFGDILNEKFIDTLHPYQEVAIGGGDATSHPDLIPFLHKLKDRKVIANMTVNQIHFEKKQELIKKLVDEKLIYGLGVSLVNPTDQFIELISQYPNAVIHVINGILKPSDVVLLANKNLKMLILGYKRLRRGNDWIMEDEDYCSDNDVEMPTYIWRTYKKELGMDAESIILNALEEWYEDAFDRVNDKELSLLQAALDNFCKNCGVGNCYEVDFNVCVVFKSRK